MRTYLKYILKRVGISILVVLAISVFVFSILYLIPGDPVRIMLGVEADEAMVERVRSELGLDQPLHIQYANWIRNLFQGDFGRSIVLNTDILGLLTVRLPITLSLTIPAIVISVVLGIVIGVICATHRGSVVDQLLTLIVTTMNGVPVFWIGIMFIWLFGVRLQWLPIMGYVDPMVDFWGFVRSAILPVTIISFGPLSTIARQVRTNMLEVINQDYIRTAKAYGLSNGSIRYKYALKNTLIPIVTLVALQVRSIVGGSMLAEQVFNIAGMGRLIMQAVLNRDYLLIQALVLVISVIVVLINMLLDISYGIIDPRIRLSANKNQQ